MTIPVVVMIIIGIIIIIVSFFLTEKLAKKEENVNMDLLTVDDEYEFSERELQIIKRKIEDVIAMQAKDILYQTNESLSNMANEKTMALGDYAVAVCEEIEKNHKEVMFLYSMLDDKRKEIMNTVKVVDDVNRNMNETITDVGDASHNINEAIVEVKKQISILEALIEEVRQIQAAEVALEGKISTSVAIVEAKQHERNHQSIDSLEKTDKAASKADFADTPERQEEDGMQQDVDEIDDDLDFDDILAEINHIDPHFEEESEEWEEQEKSNDVILELHRSGNSIIDIAKQLGLGVGEVKLVIDLYQGE